MPYLPIAQLKDQDALKQVKALQQSDLFTKTIALYRNDDKRQSLLLSFPQRLSDRPCVLVL
jgi:hypothetical protein